MNANACSLPWHRQHLGRKEEEERKVRKVSGPRTALVQQALSPTGVLREQCGLVGVGGDAGEGDPGGNMLLGFKHQASVLRSVGLPPAPATEVLLAQRAKKG